MMDRQIDEYWDKYLSLYSFESVLQKYRVRRAIEFLEASTSPNRSILEVGCGFHPLFEVYSHFSSFTAVEPGSRAFRAVTELAGDDRRIHLINDYLEGAIPALGGLHFDAIVVSAVLQEIPDPVDFLRSLRELMGETTIVYVNVSNAASLHRLIGLKMGVLSGPADVSERAKNLGQVRSYTTEDVCELVVSSLPDVSVSDSGTFFVKPFTHEQMMACLDAGIIDDSVLDALYAATDGLPELGSELFVAFRRSEN